MPGRELCCPPCARAARSPRCAGPWNGVPRLRCRENVGQARERRQRTTNANWRAATSAEIKKRKRAVSPHPDSTAAQRSLAREPFCACQAKQQRSRTQSCTGAFLRLPGKAATQQNAVLHGLLVLLARGGSNTLGKHGGHPARRASSPAVIQHDGTVRRKSWPSRGYPVLGHRVGQHGSQCDHSLPSWGFAAVCLTGEAGVRLM